MSATQIAPQEPITHHETRSVSTQVRCFVYAVGAKCYRAECIDLDIAAEGTTEREARRGLRNAMYGYLNVLCEDEALQQAIHNADEKALRKLILRPSPFPHRAHYYLGKIRQKALTQRRDYAKSRFYTVPAPCSL